MNFLPHQSKSPNMLGHATFRSGNQSSKRQAQRSRSHSARGPQLVLPIALLPIEIQLHIFSYVPAKTLTRAVAPTSSHNKALVDRIIQRKLTSEICTTAPKCNNVIVFEAQRPIDTLTTRHILHLSHFGDAPPNGTKECSRQRASPLMVTFDFVPQIEKAEHVGNWATDGADPSQDDIDPLQPINAPQQDRGPAYGQTSYLGVLDADRHRLRQEHISSSLPSSGANTPRSRRQQLSPERRYSAYDAGRSRAGSSRLAQGPAVRSREERDRYESASTPPIEVVSDGRGQGYEQSVQTLGAAQHHSTWSEPVSSSLSAADERSNLLPELSTLESSEQAASVQELFRAGCRSPMYRFQLEALDSFETWILSLTVEQRRGSLSDANGGGRDTPQRWEKRVAEGLDRVFRDWFVPNTNHHTSNASMDDSSLDFQHGFASKQRIRSGLATASHSYKEKGTASNTFDAPRSALAQYISSFPATRKLEIDGEGCTMQMQPHANREAGTHPALASMSSHYYLSTSSPYVAAPTENRVEYTFHCKSVQVNAARLLSTIEDIEADAERARQIALSSAQRGRLVALAAGGSSWSPSTTIGAPLSVMPRGRTFMGGRDAAATVVMFGAARD